mgnify:CR=1 FL=1
MFCESAPYLSLGGGLAFAHTPRPRLFTVTRDFTTGRVSTEGKQTNKIIFPDNIEVSEFARPEPFEGASEPSDTESESSTETANTETGIYPIEVSEGIWRGSCGCKRRYVTRGSCETAHCRLFPSRDKLSVCLW